MASKTAPLAPVLVGNPFFSTGRGSTVIGFMKALHTAGMNIQICDAFSRKLSEKIDTDIEAELEGWITESPSQSINIYHINGDEIDLTQEFLNHKLPDQAYNIIYPFWELEKYPAAWAEKLQLFDEVWACSKFIEQSITKVVTKPIHHIPLPVEVEMKSFLGRHYFNLPEHAYLFLFFFDFRSYISRKNPDAVIRVLEKVLAVHPSKDVRVVIKVQNVGASPKSQIDYEDFSQRIRKSPVHEKIILINGMYDSNEIKNLVRCCDCFISLHRSEGYGLGMAEAMYLEKAVIGTAYSGNMDFMDKSNSLLVDYDLIPVPDGEYPFSDNQVWADPDLDQAAFYMDKLLDEPDFGYKLGKKASNHIRTNFSYLSIGLKIRQRLDKLLSQ